MLLTIEKVLILKSVKIFSSVPEAQLVDMATVVETVEYDADDVIIRQGELGTSMYILATGKVRFFDGDKALGVIGGRAVFGELSALDPEPRSVSVAAVEDCTLLRLNGESLYELMAGNKEVTRGIVHVLCEYARNNLALATRNQQDSETSPTDFFDQPL
jgi:CRP-like cAMP-binding protein